MYLLRDLGWRWRWRRPAARPRPRPALAVLGSIDEWRAARAEARALGLPRHPDPPKTWDTLAAIDAVVARVPLTGRVLDAGGELYSTLLPSLARYGYRDLHAINLAFDRPRRRGPIVYQPGDATRTTWADGAFDAITCLSVIEHGVDVERFLAEAARLLRPGGVLVISTDYWPAPVETHGRTAYGTPIKIFDRDDLGALLAAAARHQLTPPATVDDALAAAPAERAVTWQRHDLRYTFAVLTLIRN
ncbi:MAG: class I SAM-dependent methyltransferase [Myxococcales bacterium]|jgi:SAM-dependent methyltransferase|nr:class I SAM-dependent methyltransferase [Myxococcales bacterium]MBK7194352.1 class I SAM-dependent methyltransferase [Myxococcales bacterium]MBP6846480.1 class I SAM-dependent methyltransferase [Kofleriaceae bacterium]